MVLVEAREFVELSYVQIVVTEKLLKFFLSGVVCKVLDINPRLALCGNGGVLDWFNNSRV